MARLEAVEWLFLMPQTNINEAKADLSTLIDAALVGEEANTLFYGESE